MEYVNREITTDLLVMSPYRRKRLIPEIGNRFRPYEKRVHKPFHETLHKEHPELKCYSPQQIKEHIIAFNKALGKELTDNRHGFTFPQHLGNAIIASHRSGEKARKRVDWKYYNETEKVRYVTNMHSRGYKCRVYYIYSIEKYNFANCSIWNLMPDQTVKNNMAKHYFEDWKKYVILPNVGHVQRFIKQYWTKEWVKKKNMKLLETYNEFEGLI